MSFHHSFCSKFFSWLFVAFSLCSIGPVFGQTVIVNGDGTNLTTNWCHNDTMHRIVGQPAGGSFSGCGVIEENGVWYFNPSVAAAGQSSVYYCTLTYTPPQGDPKSVSMVIQMPLGIWLREDSIVTCDGNFFLFADFANVGSVKWHWTPGADLVDSSQKGTAGTTFEDKVYIFNAQNMNNGCTDMAEVRVYYRGVEASFTASKDTVCMHERVYFSADSTDPVFGYAWYSGDGVSSSGENWEYAYPDAGVYGVTYILNNEYCYDTLVKEIVVRDFELDLYASKLLVDRGTPLLLQTGADEAYSVRAWFPDDLFWESHAYSQQVVVDSTTTYTVVAESAYGCVDTARLTIRVNPIVYIPSSFTPNGDGLNDFFRIVNWGDPITVHQFRIFDRWGREVWAGNGANAFIGWDGSYNGEPAQAGVYYYVFEGQLPSGVVTSQQGDVTLLR